MRSKNLALIMVLVVLCSMVPAHASSPNPFELAETLKAALKSKDFSSLKSHLSPESQLSAQEFAAIWAVDADEALQQTALLIEASDLIYLEAGKTEHGRLSGVIYFIKRASIAKRRIWLEDYAACAFETHGSRLRLVRGFCFVGTDGPPELDAEVGNPVPSS